MDYPELCVLSALKAREGGMRIELELIGVSVYKPLNSIKLLTMLIITVERDNYPQHVIKARIKT